MTARELPELPVPMRHNGTYESSAFNFFTAEQMHQYALDAIEKAAPRVSEGMVAILDTLLLNWKSRADRLGNSFGPGDMIISAALQDCIRELEAALAQRGKEEHREPGDE